MQRRPVASSSVKSVGYDRARQIMEIEFLAGGVYWYRGVPESVYKGLLDAVSIGRYFQEEIRERYPFLRVR